eukprot:UC1_evm1s2073
MLSGYGSEDMEQGQTRPPSKLQSQQPQTREHMHDKQSLHGIDIDGTDGSYNVPEAYALPAPRISTTDLSLEESIASRRSSRKFAVKSLSLSMAGQLLWVAQGVTHTALHEQLESSIAYSHSGQRHRSVPTAGGLYPLNCYLVAGAVDTIAPGVYRYRPGPPHDLVRQPNASKQCASKYCIRALSASTGQDWVADCPAAIVITGTYARTGARYPHKASLFVHLEAGAAMQNLQLESTALGLGSCVVGAFGEQQLAMTLGLPESETPLCIVTVGHLDHQQRSAVGL